MKKLLATLLLVTTACSYNKYIAVEVAYKFNESHIEWDDYGYNDSFANKIACAIEAGLESHHLMVGFRHTSQCGVGAPFDDKQEYSVNTFFFRRKFTF